MSNSIDCSVMSHAACQGPEPETATLPGGGAPAPVQPAGGGSEPLLGSYDCVNDCASSLGVVTLVQGAVAGLGCFALPPACPAFVAAVPVTILGACDSACRELEAR
jgi:hypothetical protein